MKRSEKTILLVLAVAIAILLFAFYYGCREGGQESTAGDESRVERSPLVRV